VLTVIGEQESDWLAFQQPDMDSRTFALCVRPMHMHRRIIMSHNLVTETKKMLRGRKIGTQIAFRRDMTSNIHICILIPPMTRELSPCLRQNLISIWWLAVEAICRGESLRVQQASHSEWVINWAQRWVQDRIYSCSTVASQDVAKYHYFPVEKSLLAFAIFWGQCQHTP